MNLVNIWSLAHLNRIPGGSDGKESACWRPKFDPWVGKIPWRRKWQPTPIFLPGKSHRWRSLAGYSPLGRKESRNVKFFFLTFTPGFNFCLWSNISIKFHSVFHYTVQRINHYLLKIQPFFIVLCHKSNDHVYGNLFLDFCCVLSES